MKRSGQVQSERLVAEIAQRIGQRQLAMPALLLLETFKPLAFVASQGLLLCQPVLGFFYDGPTINRYADFLADRSNLEQLIAQLECQGAAPQPGQEGIDDST